MATGPAPTAALAAEDTPRNSIGISNQSRASLIKAVIEDDGRSADILLNAIPDDSDNNNSGSSSSGNGNGSGTGQAPSQHDASAAAGTDGRPEGDRQPGWSHRNEDRRSMTSEEERKEDIVFYTQQVHRIIGPICVCILLAIFWVKMSQFSVIYKPSGSSLTYFKETSSSTATENFAGAIVNALIIISAIIAATIVFVVLFYFNCMRLIFAYLMLVVATLLGFFGWLITMAALDVFNVPMDYMTLIFFIFNFAVVGVLSVFWQGPLWLQQGYLVVMSSMMAFSLTGLQEWTSWTLLAALAVWDLIAVLCPFGPLRLLVETSKSQNREVPALLYSVTMVWLMADANPPSAARISANNFPASSSNNRDDSQESNSIMSDEQSMSSYRPPSSMIPQRSINSVRPFSDDGDTDTVRDEPRSITSRYSVDGDTIGSKSSPAPRPDDANSHGADQTSAAASASVTAAPTRSLEANQPPAEDDDSERSGLKLGLGDFVFYSVLISRAAVYDWVTTLACVVAVLTGFTITIFLLALFRKALPALPISIAFGMIFFFLTSFMVIPYMDSFGLLGIQP